MTIIQCEFCGPERVAPHDVNCPTRQSPSAEQIVQAFGRIPVTGHCEVVGWFGTALKPVPVYGYFPADAVAPDPEPLITRNPDHETMSGRFGAVCKCGYDPHETHPDAGRGQLFAYVGYHIREASRA